MEKQLTLKMLHQQASMKKHEKVVNEVQSMRKKVDNDIMLLKEILRIKNELEKINVNEEEVNER